MQSSPSRVILIGLFLSMVAQAARAQEMAGSFDQLRVLLKSGDKVRVTDSTGQEVQGAIAELSSSSLALQSAGSRRTFLEGDVTAIHRRRPDSLANGAKWGFVIGAGLGVLAGVTLVSEYGDGASAVIPVFALIYGGLGTGAGVGIDAMISGNQVIYARRGASSRVSLRPILTPDQKGVLASIRLF